jgi:hypothetical protein
MRRKDILFTFVHFVFVNLKILDDRLSEVVDFVTTTHCGDSFILIIILFMTIIIIIIVIFIIYNLLFILPQALIFLHFFVQLFLLNIFFS